MTDKEKMYRRQLGGAEAALRRERQRVKALEELIRDMWRDGMCECDEAKVGTCAECEYGYLDRMRELGIEVEQ